MGGYFSTRWNYHNKKQTTEGSLTIDLARLHKTGWLKRDTLKQQVIGNGSLSWYDTRTNEKTSDIRVQIDTTSDNPHMRLIYKTTMKDGQVFHTDEMVRISYTPANFGGERVWIHCPECDKRTRTLHNPPGAIRFLCRDCHDLSYASAQEAHKQDRGLFAGLGVLILLEQKYEKLQRQLWKTRKRNGKPSKSRQRIQAKMDSMWLDFDRAKVLTRQSIGKL